MRTINIVPATAKTTKYCISKPGEDIKLKVADVVVASEVDR